ncbi:acetylcholinesterase-like [Pararge aegeria]|uniref:acetylcholinesterase-like n=1 Tax=Pararge aegeria TaxID=116150 RepID=UPI0019D193E3|nr:acetylcholinesterase-like [Pararge aegeria]
MDGAPEVLSDTATNCNFTSASETISDNNYQAKQDSLEKKAVHLRLMLEKDFKAADLKWSLFVAAAFSFGYESCLKPFPPVFMKNGIKDMDELLSVITDVPALDLVLQQLDNLENLSNISDILDLLFYVLVRLKEPSLKTIPQEAHDAVLINAHSLLAASKPQYIFQVVSSCKSNAELKWKELTKNHRVFYAYHGNRLENFYSILNFGLQQHLHKTNIKGNGVNLSPELCLSIPYSHGGFGWGASCIGGHLSCIAMCEVIDAHEGINYHVKPVTNEGDGVYEQEKMLNAETGARTSHFVVTNCDLIRVRYLLVYAKQPTSMRFPTTTSNREVGGLRQWFAQHKLFSILLGYGLMLATIGFANNQPIHYYYKILLKKIDGALSNPPERHTGWRRTLFAHRMPPRCRQSANETESYKEDCLYLNIWTPRRVDGKLLPVVIILYSDSWTKNGITLPCQELAAEGVVVVTVAYRLHILSFFTLKSIKARGNLALLDQYMALLWIRENIVAFGGDPNAITLLGHSAGADSILYHIISPRTVGLFQRAIIMSPNNIWKAVENDGETNFSIEKMSQTVIKSLSCVRGSENEILQCLRTRSASDLFNSISNNWTINNEIFQPITDNFLPEKEQYLPLSLSAALVSSKSPNIQLDVLLGTADLDTINYDFNYEDVARRGQDSLYELASLTIIPEILSLLSIDRPDTLPLLSQAIRWEFLGPKTRSQSGVDGIMKLTETIARMETSAKWGAGCALLAAKLARRVSHLYTYRYSIPTDINLYGRTINFTGATHGAEIMTLLGNALMLQIARRTATQSEKKLSMQFRNYIINFVKFGSPDNQNEWPRYIVGDSYIHEICKKEASNCNKYKTSKEIAFWLQYLPRLSSILTSNEQAENVITSNDEKRLHGGVVAMCGVSITLLLLLCACVVILHRWRTRRPMDIDEHEAKL